MYRKSVKGTKRKKDKTSKNTRQNNKGYHTLGRAKTINKIQNKKIDYKPKRNPRPLEKSSVTDSKAPPL